MSEPSASKPRRRIWKYLAVILGIGLLGMGLVAWYATTDSFQAMVRKNLAAQLERITGGRVELGSVHTVPFRFLVDVRDLTVHGREAADEAPFIHVDRLLAVVKVYSMVGANFVFTSLVIERPTIHIITYPDGTTNQPQPQTKPSQNSPAEHLVSLAIGHLEVRRGELLYNDQKIPLDFNAANLSANLDYSFLRRRY